jgi:hypothetical protein
MKRVVWISGTFRLTNGLIDDLRAAGKFEGYAKAKGWPIRGGHDAYAEHQQAVRLAAKAAAVKQLPAGPLVFSGAGKVDLSFFVFGHHHHDPDAWSLLGKAATDGLTDAEVLASDRFDVWTTAGRVFQSIFEEVHALARLATCANGKPPAGFRAGLAIVTTVVAPEEGHA